MSTPQRQPLQICACCCLKLINTLQNMRRVRLQRVSVMCFGWHVHCVTPFPPTAAGFARATCSPAPPSPRPPPCSHLPLRIGISGTSCCGKSALARSKKSVVMLAQPRRSHRMQRAIQGQFLQPQLVRSVRALGEP